MPTIPAPAQSCRSGSRRPSPSADSGKFNPARRRATALAVVSLAALAVPVPARAVTVDLPGAGTARHALLWPQLESLSGKRLRDPGAFRLLAPALKRLLGKRHAQFMAAMAEQQPLRLVGRALVGQGIVPSTLGYRGAFFAFGAGGQLLAVLKDGHNGGVIERFGAVNLLRDRRVLEAYLAFVTAPATRATAEVPGLAPATP